MYDFEAAGCWRAAGDLFPSSLSFSFVGGSVTGRRKIKRKEKEFS
jgi:hypothetical protein